MFSKPYKTKPEMTTGSMNKKKYVIKRNGQREIVSFDKITRRIDGLSDHLDVNPYDVSQKTINGLEENMKTSDIDELTANICMDLSTTTPDYGVLGSRIIISNVHKNTLPSFSDAMWALYHNKDADGLHSPLISYDIYELTQEYADVLDEAIDDDRDYLIDYFGFKTLEKSYLKSVNNEIVERPQYMWMRVSLGIHGKDINEAIQTYDFMSNKYFIHATPTLFNSGTPVNQLASCFLINIKDDSIKGIYETLGDTATISRMAGGIGLSVSGIRAAGTTIKGTGGESKGLVPMLKVYNSTAVYCDQGGNKRKGSFAIYLEPWHADIFDWLLLKKGQGKDEKRSRDLFYGLWVPDLFMKRVKEKGMWSLMCPKRCPGLQDSHGLEFEKLYLEYELTGKYKRQVPALELWEKIIESQIETGMPYMLYKDACNSKSNQQNLGTIKSSNLCTEIIEYTSPEEIAVCNLASMALPTYVKYRVKTRMSDDSLEESVDCLEGSTDSLEESIDFEDGKVYEPYFDYEELYQKTRTVTKNLNKVIDKTHYPVKETKTSNMKHRPIGIGVQGLADVFNKFRVGFDSEKARELNRYIFETIYFAAMTESCQIASKYGHYESYIGSPISKGQFQFDLWKNFDYNSLSGMWDWEKLRTRIKTYGVRNSLLLAPMPTASTSQILGFNECFEPYTTNIYTRRTLAGIFKVLNADLIYDLIKLGIWSESLKEQIILHEGSIQNIPEIPDDIKDIYKTVWDMSQKTIIDMAADRSPFICQSQSMNLFLSGPTIGKISSMHFYAWEKGLKTGMYYLRTKAALKAVQTSLSIPNKQKSSSEKYLSKGTPENMSANTTDYDGEVCTMEEGCISCGS